MEQFQQRIQNRRIDQTKHGVYIGFQICITQSFSGKLPYYHQECTYTYRTRGKKIIIQNFFDNLAKWIKYPGINVYQTPLLLLFFKVDLEKEIKT